MAAQYESAAYSTVQAKLAENVERLREDRRWTQEEAAHQCAMSTRQYQHVEHGLANVTLTTVAGSNHSKDLCEYEITSDAALLVGEPLRAYGGLLTGAPTHWERQNGSKDSRPGVR